jgi:hypothetical protein
VATVLQRDITDALQRLRAARTARNEAQIDLCEQKMNRLLDKVSRPKTD